jgi:hypothetical protein
MAHFEALYLLSEFAVVENSFNLFSEGDEVLDGLSFAGKDHVEFVVKIFIGFVPGLINFL